MRAGIKKVSSKSVNFDRLKTSSERTDATVRSMRGNRASQTRCEKLLKQNLLARGMTGYRLNRANLPGKPDISFGRTKLAIFVHGCFWHTCPACSAAGKVRVPKTNIEYWTQKLARNESRFAEQSVELANLGWEVMVVWECEIKRDLDAVISRISSKLCDKTS